MDKTISLAELEADPEAVAKDMRATGTVYWIRRPGKPTVRLRQLPSWLAVIDMMGNPNWREDLEQSERDFAEGRGHKLEDVLAELGRGRRTERPRERTARRPARNRRSSNRGRSGRARGRSA